MGRLALVLAMQRAAVPQASSSRRRSPFVPSYIQKTSRNQYEQWSDPTVYITDDYRQSFHCTGLAQQCRGSDCAVRYTDGDIGCYHGNFHTSWTHDDHVYCNCQQLTCLDDSSFVIYGDGFDDKSGCEKMIGSWQHVGSSNEGFTVSFQYGFKKTEEWSFSTTEEYTESVTRSASVGIEVKGRSGSAGVSSTVSQSLVQSHSQSFSVEQSQTTTYTYNFPEGGYAWVWQYDFYSAKSGHDPVITKTKDLFKTAVASEPPCCLPGYWDGTKCTDGPNLCEQIIQHGERPWFNSSLADSSPQSFPQEGAPESTGAEVV